MISFLFDNH